jgi:hypothetical protein
MVITIDNVTQLDLSEVISTIPNKKVVGRRYFKVRENLNIVLSDGSVIFVKAGFHFDGSSVPTWLRGVFPSYGPILFASMIHDWMYLNDYRREEIGLKTAQLVADKEMLIWSTVCNHETWWERLDNKIRYRAVRLFGKKVYKR